MQSGGQSNQYAATQRADLAVPVDNLAKFERVAFIIAVVCACAMMWLVERLPMVDLPQHAAQVSLWRDLLLGNSPWVDLVRINLVTPYLIGYGTMLPLSFIFSMETSTRLVVTLAFLAFVWACVALRREFGSDRRLDWLFILSFFGFCWKWGFMTFLVASPVGLLVILLALRHSREPTLKRALALVAGGTLLLFSHGLVYLGLMFIAGLIMLESVWTHKTKDIFARMAPYLVMGAITLAFRIISQKMEGGLHADGYFYGTPLWRRPTILLADITDINDENGSILLMVLTGLILLAPLFYGMRLNTRAALVPVLGLLLIVCVAPADAFQTGGLYYRFALFIPPFIAFAFVPNPNAAKASLRAYAALAVITVCSLWVLVIQASRIVAFGEETKPFQAILDAMQPNKRVLAMVMQGDSIGAQNTNAYWHYPVWYQADKHGFVDFNFALFPPQVIRFKLDRKEGENEEVDLRPGQNKMWTKGFVEQFTYFVIKSDPPMTQGVQAQSPCQLNIKLQVEDWVLLERGACP